MITLHCPLFHFPSNQLLTIPDTTKTRIEIRVELPGRGHHEYGEGACQMGRLVKSGTFAIKISETTGDFFCVKVSEFADANP